LGEHEQATAAQNFVVWVGRQTQDALPGHHVEILKKVVWHMVGWSLKHGPIVEAGVMGRTCNKGVRAVPLPRMVSDAPEKK
jgi:hypothetical protein